MNTHQVVWRTAETSIYARRMLYVQYTNPAGYPPLEHSSRILAREETILICRGERACSRGSVREYVQGRLRHVERVFAGKVRAF